MGEHGKDGKHQPDDCTLYLWLQTPYLSNRLFQSLYLIGIIAMVEKIVTCSAQDWRASSDLWSPFFFYNFFYKQQKAFPLHLFKYTFALSAKRLFSGTWVGLFQASVCSGDHSVAISLSSNLEFERTSTSATCLHWSYFMSTRKAAFWIQERILYQFLKKGTFGAPECLSNISIYLLCKSYKKVCYMKHLSLHSPFY